MKDYKRLTTDNPSGSLEQTLNGAFVKNGEVYLRSVDCGEDKSLCEYISRLAKSMECKHSSQDVMDGACTECDCYVSVLYALAIQAAELRQRLAELEDKLESGELFDLTEKTIKPLGIGDRPIGWEIWGYKVEEVPEEFGFDTKEAAEARLKELQEQKK